MPPAINAARLNRSLSELGRFGDTPQGMQRLAFSPADVESRVYLSELLRNAGLTFRVDAAGNLIGRKPGADPLLRAIALGSHTDTVPNGGKYDGALGVVAAIEVAQALADSGVMLRHPLEIINFTNEEGTRYHRWLFGSRAMAGLLEPDDLTPVDAEGAPLAERLKAIGGDLSRIEQARRQRGELAAYFELHIEQGPVLHRSGFPIGVVTAITGRTALEATLRGKANHAGTTPMAGRQDALLAASHLIQLVHKIAGDMEICRVGTVGAAAVEPNAVNVIPGVVRLGLEFRDERPESMAAAETFFRAAAAELEDAHHVAIRIERLESTPSAPIPGFMQEMAAEAAARLGLATQRLPSGAGHDAQAIANIAPIAMLFIPSVGGVSHAPDEFSTPEDCANGAAALLNLLLLADQRLP